MDGQDVILTKKEGIATITLNRPDKMNALIPEITDGLYKAVENATKDNEVRVLVITGTGRAFCAGADVKAMAKNANLPPETQKERVASSGRIPTSILLQQCMKPIIASINGFAIGGGLDLALACDIRIASDDARLAEAHVRRGMVPMGGGALFLPRLIGIDKACLLIWTGDMIDAKEAERIGLVTKVVPRDELESETYVLADKLAKGPAQAIQLAKQLIYEGLGGMDLKTHLEHVAAARKELMKTSDHKEGVNSFVEKRAAVFKGDSEKSA